MMRFGLRRRADSVAAEAQADVIDLTDPPPAAEQAAEADPDPDAEQAPEADPYTEQAAAPAEPPEADAGRLGRLAWVVGLLTLSTRFPARLSPAGSVVAATTWALAVVVVGCLVVTAAAALIGGRGLFDPDIFLASWRVAHLMPVATESGPVTLVPMLPAIAVWLLMLRACSWLWHRLSERTRPTPLAGISILGGGYVLVAALIAASPTATSDPAPRTQGWAALVLLALTPVMLTWLRMLVRPNSPRLWLLLKACGRVVGVVLAVSFLVLIIQLLLNWSQFQESTDGLLSAGAQPASRFDAAALGAVQLAYLPNVTVWTASYLLGAGFSVGTDTIVSPFTVTVGTVPDLPLTTLLPTVPMGQPWLPPVLLGLSTVGAGALVRGTGLAGRMRSRLVIGMGIAVTCAASMAVLAGLSNGGLGPGRLESVGPGPWMTFVAALLVFGLGQVVWAIFPTLLADLLPYLRPSGHWARRTASRRPKLRVRPPRFRRGRAGVQPPPSIDE